MRDSVVRDLVLALVDRNQADVLPALIDRLQELGHEPFRVHQLNTLLTKWLPGVPHRKWSSLKADLRKLFHSDLVSLEEMVGQIDKKANPPKGMSREIDIFDELLDWTMNRHFQVQAVVPAEPRIGDPVTVGGVHVGRLISPPDRDGCARVVVQGAEFLGRTGDVVVAQVRPENFRECHGCHRLFTARPEGGQWTELCQTCEVTLPAPL